MDYALKIPCLRGCGNRTQARTGICIHCRRSKHELTVFERERENLLRKEGRKLHVPREHLQPRPSPVVEVEGYVYEIVWP